MEKKLYKIVDCNYGKERYVRMTKEQERAMEWMVDFLRESVKIEESNALNIEEI